MPTRNREFEATFADRVKLVVSKIPRGKVLSYKEVARLAGNEKAFRAVATVMRKNYDPKIPCHRVIRSNGSIGEYNRGGEVAKLKILTEEGWNQQI